MAQVSNQTELQQALDQGAQLIHIVNGFTIESQITINYTVLIQSLNGIHLWSLTRLTGYTGKMFSVETGGNLTLQNLILDGDKANTPAAESVITTNAVLTMQNVMVLNNASTENGGGICVNGTDAVVTMNHCVVQGCECIERDGGGMFNNGSSPAIKNCTFSGNTARGNGVGGGIANSGGSPVLSGCTFSYNTASSGGGMYNALNSNPTLTDCFFSNNYTSMFDGGGIFNNHSSPALTGCIFYLNGSAHYGGGMYTNIGSPTLTDCTFNCNNAQEDGGGVYTLDSASKPMFFNCTFSYNTAKNGGGMSDNISSPSLTNCSFFSNSAQFYGGGLFGLYETAVLNDCTLMNNKAQNGGGMSQITGTITFKDGRIGGNTAAKKGGGIYLGAEGKPMKAVFTGTALYDNTSANGGGVYVGQNGRFTFNNGVIYWNIASNNGGGIYLHPNGQAHIGAPLDINGNSASHGEGIYMGSMLGISGAVDIRNGVFPVSEEYLIQVEGSISGANIQLENSPYAYPNPDSVPINVAEATTEYPHLNASDSKTFKIPPSGFSHWYVRLNEDNTRIQLDIPTVYTITYENLMGARNSNPKTYNPLNLPVKLWSPCPIPDYYFSGWFGADGNQITVINAGTAGDITLHARWEENPAPMQRHAAADIVSDAVIQGD